MSTFNLISIKYGADGVFDPWIEDGRAEAWFTNMAASDYYSWLSEYNSGKPVIGSYGGQFTISADTSQPATITQDQILSVLRSAIDVNIVPAPDNTTQYILHFPKGIAVNDGPDMVSCTISVTDSDAFCGYHSNFDYNGVLAKFSIIPYSSDCPSKSCGSTFEDYGSTISHEIAETITDPLATSWFDDCNEEIGDICENENNVYAKGSDGKDYPVQLLWSNSRKECYGGQSSSDLINVPTGMPTAKPQAGLGGATTEMPSMGPSKQAVAAPTGMPTAKPQAGLGTIEMKKRHIESFDGSKRDLKKRSNLRSKL